MQPIELNKRIDTLDYLRGFALLGIILVNIPGLLRMEPPNTSVDITYNRFLTLFVEGKFFTIFSFLFGVGFYIFISRAMAKHENAYLLFIRRMIILLIIGLVHFYFQPGEALTIYAIFGLIALPFYKVRKEINLTIGLILLAVSAYYGIKIVMPFPLILLGLAAGQYRIFEKIHDNRKRLVIMTVIMFFISIGGLLYQWHYVPEAMVNFDHMTESELNEHVTNFEKFALIGLQFSPFVSAFYVGLLMLLLQLPLCQVLLSPLKDYGRMALTNYLGQTALILMIGNAFHLIGNIRFIQSLWICIGIYIFQLLFSKIWLRFFKFGPVEWLWRMGTYWTVPSLLKSKERS
ncbi:DUF418 domain-containing protein [Lysinibacillus agricola]|uniref:DUF418 domain-containing protein n=1 Tax=Lysinibacillus agricola TaxID=2590012 RepID=A0ABX7AKX5_9BACI|nr:MULTISPECIES: DUF418 domain-containing protein [Lysinibacillus]KOS64685.1 hypothetical protein AN161_01300 [Lysinibacillus sp. FJAT-14222]QQP10485.1 DUF418 domain-containing protein [Lysinibacillus agricola]